MPVMMPLFTPPQFADEDQTLIARHHFIILWTFMGTGGLVLLITLFIPETLSRWLVMFAAIESAGLSLLFLNSRGHTRLVSHLMILVLWAMATGMVLTDGGITSNDMAFFLIIVLIAGLIQSGRAGFVTAILCILTGLFLVYLEYSGRLPASQVPHTPLTAWIASTVYMVVIISLQYLVSRTIRKALMASRQELKERQRASEALRASEELSGKLIRSSPDIVVRLDLQGDILFINEVGLTLSGYREEEMIGKNMLNFISPEDQGRAARNTVLMLEGRLGPQEYCLVMKDGSKRLFEANGDVLRREDGAPYGLVQICRDISGRKKAEEALQRHNSYLESLNETALGLMGRTDLTDLFQSILDKAVRFSNVAEGWICIHDLVKNDFEFRAVAGRRDRAVGSRFEFGLGITGEVWRTGKTVLVDDYHLWAKRTKLPEYDMRRAALAIPLRYEGRLAGILGLVHHDQTKGFPADEIAMLERLAELASLALDNARLHDRLKRELVERAQAEQEKLRLLERLQRSEKMEALGKMAGGVAHDLNNVLGILSGYSELLLLEIPEGHRARGHVERILQSTEKGAAIIQDLLTLTRRGVVASEVINLNGIVEAFLEAPLFEKIKEAHPRISFRSDCDRALLNIKGSPVHLEKTLMNLVLNAVESITGEGEVVIRTESRYLDKAVRGYDEFKEGDYAVLAVSDTGVGIPTEIREKIFEPFFTKKTMGRSGTGLGLAIVWGTVKDHYGYIDLRSEEGRGSTFLLFFPVTREELAGRNEKPPLELYRGKGESVLVVDDVAEQREVACGLLTQLGYEVHAAAGGEEALEYLRRNEAAILVLDMIMEPGIDGLETYRRALEINPRQKAILVSGFSETGRVREAQRLGAGAYVKKPYVMEQIGIAIYLELNRSEAPSG
jgi:PAS domain S-box-containing protein